MLLVRRPKDAREAQAFIRNAHIDTEKDVDDIQCPHYAKFWKGLKVLLKTGIFQNMHIIVSRNVFSQLVVNRGTPVFERTIRNSAEFESIVKQQLKHRKCQRRIQKYENFVQNVIDKSQICLQRSEVENDLRHMAQECNDAFLNKDVVECIKILYISMKSFRRIVKLLNSRIDRTFLEYNTFASNEAMHECEAQDVINMVM